MSDVWDYIIVGGGSAGCVLANRLSSDPASKVLLLEAGGENNGFLIKMPKGFGKTLANPDHVYFYPSKPMEGGADPNPSWISGKGLGGGSAVNGMLYVRGQPEDYAEWARLAGPEWTWAKMKAAFRKIEDHELGDDGNRGVGGPIGISISRMRSPLTERMIEAGVQMGLPRREDLNGEGQEGVGYYPQTIRHGRRVTAAFGFLNPVRNRPNLTVLTHVVVDRIEFEGDRAVGVIATQNGGERYFHCRGEIILSSGVMGSPLILQRSGIGPTELLERHGIAVRRDAPVGQHLCEHFVLRIKRALKGPRGQNHLHRSIGLVGSMFQYLVFRRGVMADSVWEVGLFAKSSPERSRPDVQFDIGGITEEESVMRNGKMVRAPGKFPAMTVYVFLNRMDSEGAVSITSADPKAPALVDTNALSTARDRKIAVDGFRLGRRYLEQPALKAVLGEEYFPKCGDSDDEILEQYQKYGFAGLHATGTCAMGTDPNAVTDERLRVRGVRGLRVVDCSAMPTILSANTNGPVMALAWRASDLILEDKASTRS